MLICRILLGNVIARRTLICGIAVNVKIGFTDCQILMRQDAKVIWICHFKLCFIKWSANWTKHYQVLDRSVDTWIGEGIDWSMDWKIVKVLLNVFSSLQLVDRPINWIDWLIAWLIPCLMAICWISWFCIS